MAENIKTMKLYNNVERIWNEVNLWTSDSQAKLDVERLNSFDMYNYCGATAMDEFICNCGVTSDSSVLDVGCGIGGPARYVAKKVNATVVAIDIQSDCIDAAVELTRRCSLSHLVDFLVGDFCDGPGPSLSLLGKKNGRSKFDSVSSWLVFLHVPLVKRPVLFSSCFSCLRTDGIMQIEDYFMINPFTAVERQSLLEDVYCPGLPTQQQYIAALEGAGFVDVVFESMTDRWNEFVHSRLEVYKKQKDRHTRIHGIATVVGLTFFYERVAELFAGGNLGGARILARRP